MKSKLAYDMARCLDDQCPERYDCLRYMERNNLGDRTPIFATLRPPDSVCTDKITARPEKN